MIINDPSVLKCSFCGKNAKATQVITGTSSSICVSCVESCQAIIEEQHQQDIESEQKRVPKPQDIFNFLNLYIVGQEKAKRALSVAVYNHYKRIFTLSPFASKHDVEIQKSNILLMGPTGTGKTHLAKTLAKIMDVPFVVVDATVLTEAGYIGEDVESILQHLIHAADGDIERAEQGIIYVDEIDKIARKAESANMSRDVSGEGVQQGLLKIIEGANVSVQLTTGRKTADQETVQIDTTNILFICSGAFAGLDEIISKRVHKAGVGFGAELKKEIDQRILELVEMEDLQEFGFIPEFIGRLPVITNVEPLSRDQLIEIMTEPKNSIIKQYTKLFEIDKVKLEFEPEALEMIAEIADDRKTGARGLRSTFEKLLKDTMFDLPSRKDIGGVVVTAQTVQQMREGKKPEPELIPKIAATSTRMMLPQVSRQSASNG